MIPGYLTSLITREKALLRPPHHLALPNPSFMPVWLTGGIGDVVLSIDALKILEQHAPVVLYSHHAKALRYFWDGSSRVFDGAPEYAWCLHFNSIARFYTSEAFSGFLDPKSAALFHRQRFLMMDDDDLSSVFHQHPNKDFLLALLADERGWNRREFPLRTLGFWEPLSDAYPRTTHSEKYITIHDGYDAQNNALASGRSTKQWSWASWNKLVKELHVAYPDYKIIQLGASTARPIDGVDKDLIGQTSITEAFDVIKHAAIHIDGDSGLVHAATRMGIPCVVMWGPTPMNFYSYPQNVNLHSGHCDNACYWLTPNWMDRCPIGYLAPKCMDEIRVERVMEGVARAFSIS